MVALNSYLKQPETGMIISYIDCRKGDRNYLLFFCDFSQKYAYSMSVNSERTVSECL